MSEAGDLTSDPGSSSTDRMRLVVVIGYCSVYVFHTFNDAAASEAARCARERIFVY